MTFTLSDGTTSLELDSQMEWTDRNAWSPVVASASYSLTGALVIETATRQTGRPITLEGSESRGWITGSDVTQLQTWADTAAQELTLTIDTTAYTVVFRHNESPACKALPVIGWSDLDEDSDYYATLKFTVIS